MTVDAADQQLLHREFGRGVQIARPGAGGRAGRAERSQRPADAVPAPGSPATPASRPRHIRQRQRSRAPPALPGLAPPACRDAQRAGRDATTASSSPAPCRNISAAQSALPGVPRLVGNRLHSHLPYFFVRSSDMKINAIDLKPGNVLEHQNKLWLVLKREIVQPGKGGAFTVDRNPRPAQRQQGDRAVPHPGNRRARPARREGDAVPVHGGRPGDLHG